MIVTSDDWYPSNLRLQFFFPFLIFQLFKAAGLWQNEVGASLSASLSKVKKNNDKRKKKMNKQDKSQVG